MPLIPAVFQVEEHDIGSDPRQGTQAPAHRFRLQSVYNPFFKPAVRNLRIFSFIIHNKNLLVQGNGSLSTGWMELQWFISIYTIRYSIDAPNAHKK